MSWWEFRGFWGDFAKVSLYKFDNIYRLLDNLTVYSGSPRLQTFIDFYIFPT